jgi:hypothetical protein
MIWLIEEQLAYALGASVRDERVMREAEGRARLRWYIVGALHPLIVYAFINHINHV